MTCPKFSPFQSHLAWFQWISPRVQLPSLIVQARCTLLGKPLSTLYVPALIKLSWTSWVARHVSADQAKVELQPRRNNSIAFTNHNEMRSKVFHGWFDLMVYVVLLGEFAMPWSFAWSNPVYKIIIARILFNQTKRCIFVWCCFRRFSLKNLPQQFPIQHLESWAFAIR